MLEGVRVDGVCCLARHTVPYDCTQFEGLIHRLHLPSDAIACAALFRNKPDGRIFQLHLPFVATGSNSSRASAYTADRKKRGKYGISFLARLNEHSNARTEKLYCQYYNKRTGKSLVAFEYLSAPAR